MSLMTSARASLAFVAMSALTNGLESAHLKDDPTWNYANHGSDWDMGTCPDTTLY